MEQGRVWLEVPFAAKDEAKRRGARWDPGRRQWYAPPRAVAACAQWASAGDVPEALAGEDRSFGSDLFVDMVPSSCWFTNVRSCVDPVDWDRLRRMVYGRAGQRCEICGQGRDPAAGVHLEAHERWAYDDTTRVQTLRRLIALCSPCHTATHFGLAQLRGLEVLARWQLESVNGWTPQDVDLHVEGAVELWYTRCQHQWDLDLTMLTGAGIAVRRPPSATGREVAASALQVRARPAR